MNTTDKYIERLKDTIRMLCNNILIDDISREQLKIYAEAYLKNFKK
jgi:hypothetical protein